jgi:ABC-type transport system substrate-binding protein
VDIAVGCHGRRLTALARGVATIALSLCVGCGGGRSTAASPPPLRLALETEIHSLDPADATDAVGRRLVGQIFDQLVDWDPHADPPRLVPELLAELPQIDEGGLIYRMRLRQGPDAPRFSADPCTQGKSRPVTANDVAFSLLRIEPGKHAAWALLAGRIEHLDRWHAAGEGTLPFITDDANGTVIFTLTRPQPEFTEILANPALSIVPAECDSYYDGRDAAHPPFARHPVGSGPFRLDHDASQFPHSAVLVRSDDGPARPYPQPPSGPLPCTSVPGAARVVLTHFQHDGPALRAFQAGELAALAPGQAQFAEVVQDGRPVSGALPEGTTIKKFPAASIDYLVFNMRSDRLGASADPALAREHLALRRAIAVAFDVPRYLEVVRNGVWAEGRTAVVPRGLAGAAPDDPAWLAPDRARARQLLEGAGLSGRTWSLRYWGGVREAERQEAALVREFLRPLGVELELTARDNYLFDPGLQGGADLFGLRFDADFLDAANFLAPFGCAAPDNYTGYCDPDYDRGLAALLAEPPGPARDRLAVTLQEQLARDVPVRPIDQPSAWYLLPKTTGGLVRHPLAGLRVELLCPLAR